jgi:hypothetical protein
MKKIFLGIVISILFLNGCSINFNNFAQNLNFSNVSMIVQATTTEVPTEIIPTITPNPSEINSADIPTIKSSPDQSKFILGNFVALWLYDSNFPEIGSFIRLPKDKWGTGIKYIDFDWSPDNNHIVVLSFTDLMIIDVNSGLIIADADRSEIREYPMTVNWSPDGKLLNIATDYGIRFFDAITLQEVGNIQVGNLKGYSDVMWKPDASQFGVCDNNGLLRIWNRDNNEEIFNHKYANHLNIEWSASGKWIALKGGNPWSMTILDSTTFSPVKTIEDAMWTDWSKDGSILAVNFGNKAMSFYRSGDWEEISHIDFPNYLSAWYIEWITPKEIVVGQSVVYKNTHSEDLLSILNIETNTISTINWPYEH